MPAEQQGLVPAVRRVLAVILVGSQTVFAVPTEAWAPVAAAAAQKHAGPKVVVNRTVPEVTPPPSRPTFSAVPTDAEILKARVFPEPLVPVGPTTAAENVALAAALTAYADARQPASLGRVELFIDAHPTSVWQPSLALNAGLVLFKQGYITRATHDYEAAWKLTRKGTTPAEISIADESIGELIALEARLGHAGRVAQLLDEIGSRPVSGAASEWVSMAKQALFVMTHAPEEAFRCGPYALTQMIYAFAPGTLHDAKLLSTRTGPDGSSLGQLQAWAKASGIDTVAVHHASGPFPTPAVIHFTSGHFAALLRRDGTRYLVRDSVFGGEAWLREDALAEETSGFMLVPRSLVTASDTIASSDEAAQVRGKGYATAEEPNGPQKTDRATKSGPCDPGMAWYDISLMMVSIHVQDTPVTYAPPVGPPVEFTIGYNQRESNQPETFTYGNLGPKWTFDWLSYVVDDATNPDASVGVYMHGGGQDTYTGYNDATGFFAPETRKHTTLQRISSNPIQYQRTSPDGSIEVFGASDGSVGTTRRVFLTRWSDPQGNALGFTYDSQLRLVAVSDPVGQVTTLNYALPQDIWKITSVTDPFGRTASFTYDAEGRLASSTDVMGMTSSFTYGSDGYMSSMTTPYGTTTFVTTESGIDRTAIATDPLGAQETVEYYIENDAIPASDSAVPNVNGLLATGGETLTNNYLQYRNTLYWDKRAMETGAGNITQAHLYHWLHLQGNINDVTTIVESEKAALQSRTWYLYPNQTGGSFFTGDGNEPTVAARLLDDGSTQAWQATYNSLGHITSRVDPVGRTTTFTYAANEIDLTQVANTTGGIDDVLGVITWNSQHRPLTITDPAGQRTTLTFNTAGQLLTSTNARNETTTFGYNTGNELISIAGPIAGATLNVTYDGYDRPQTTTDADAYTVTYTYDALNRVIQRAYPDSSFEQFVYDRLDLAQTRDRLGRLTVTLYDADRHPIVARDPLDRVLLEAWCACGSLVSLTDPNGNVTTWTRDVMARVTSETRADHSTTTYTYENTTSRLKTITDAKGQTTTYGYAPDNAVTSVTYTNASVATPTVNVVYDAAYPRVTSMTDGTGTTTYTYVPAGTLGAGKVLMSDGPLTDDTITYGYDELGRVASRTLNGVNNTWTYDALGRLSGQGDPIGSFGYTYDGATVRLQQLTYPNGQTSTFSYLDNAHDRRLQEIHHQTGEGTTLSDFQYAYDGIGNITTWTQQYGTDVKAYDFTYDAADQLTSAIYRTTESTPTVLTRYGYGYDATGNRTTARTNDTPIAFAYNNLDQIQLQSGGGLVQFSGTTNEPSTVTVNGQAATGPTGTTFSANVLLASGANSVTVAATDPSGNTATQDYEVDVPANNDSFSYDANGNLAAQGTKSYEWDAANRLTRVLDNGTEVSRFTYDGFGRRATKTAGANTTTYLYDGDQILQERTAAGITRQVDGLEIDQHLASVDPSGAVTYYVTDHLGSVVQQTDESGAVTLTRQYDPWGAPLQGQGTSGYAYTGREWDTETGLYYYRARYYDPTAGRFIGADTDEFHDGPNPYTYALNSPSGLEDPSGHGAAMTLVLPAIETGAEVGAEIGAIGGPAGAAIGGVVGAIGGGILTIYVTVKVTEAAQPLFSKSNSSPSDDEDGNYDRFVKSVNDAQDPTKDRDRNYYPKEADPAHSLEDLEHAQDAARRRGIDQVNSTKKSKQRLPKCQS